MMWCRQRRKAFLALSSALTLQFISRASSSTTTIAAATAAAGGGGGDGAPLTADPVKEKAEDGEGFTGGETTDTDTISTDTVTDPTTGTAATSTRGRRSCRPMISPMRREALQSMYSLVGTHSAVKLCRWQKSMMRNRGGCYKWTFYGIRSHQCMEATPSIACANKCAFCWRLNSNPTAKEWKWSIDNPVTTAQEMIQTHRALVKNSSGMPGVTKDRLAEAMTPRHCALSLVGEPLLYPKVNAFLAELHRQRVSTFMVNNGQFPECLEKLGPVTQLYLSVDGPTKEIMKKLDRPVFPDFWERFNHSVDIMREMPIGRKVFRLTMIEGVNMDPEHVGHYAELFLKGQPHFIELKQLTPAFQGLKTFLRVINVPTWERVVEFAQHLCEETNKRRLPLPGNLHPKARSGRSPQQHSSVMDSTANEQKQQKQPELFLEYGIASVHEHSHCILLALKPKFFVPTKQSSCIHDQRQQQQEEGGEKGGVLSLSSSSSLSPSPSSWRTWIDFEQYHTIVEDSYQEYHMYQQEQEPTGVDDEFKDADRFGEFCKSPQSSQRRQTTGSSDHHTDTGINGNAGDACGGGGDIRFLLDPEDYWLPTPSWAAYHGDGGIAVGDGDRAATGLQGKRAAEGAGFDPQQTRHYSAKKRAHMERERLAAKEE